MEFKNTEKEQAEMELRKMDKWMGIVLTISIIILIGGMFFLIR